MHFYCTFVGNVCSNDFFINSILFNTRLKEKLSMSTIIKVNSNGSLRVEGDFEIVDAQGNKFNLNGRTSVSLCRCGLSKNLPFCDAAHKGQFLHESVAFELPPPAPKA